MSLQHTNGPWQWMAHNGGDYHTLEAASGRVLDDGSAGGEYNREIEPDSGDGYLVAAAPDLLIACRLALHKIEQTLAGQYPNGQALEATLGLLRNAIAKAKGE